MFIYLELYLNQLKENNYEKSIDDIISSIWC